MSSDYTRDWEQRNELPDCAWPTTVDGPTTTSYRRPDGTRAVVEHPAPTRPQDLKQILGKAQLEQIPLAARIWMARVLEYGASKYARGNYLRPKPDEASEIARSRDYSGAAERHLAWQDHLVEHLAGGAPVPGAVSRRRDQPTLARDAESGLPHVAHALVSLAMQVAQMVNAGLWPLDPGQSLWVAEAGKGTAAADLVHGELEGDSF
jgi:hypothetical protein